MAQMIQGEGGRAKKFPLAPYFPRLCICVGSHAYAYAPGTTSLVQSSSAGAKPL